MSEHPLELTSSTGSADQGHTLSLRDAAQRLGVSLKTVRRMVERGDLEGAELVSGPTGPRWLVSVAAVEQVLTRRKQGQPTAPVQVRASAAPEAVAEEVVRLRQENGELKQRVAVAETQAHERGQQIENLKQIVSIQALNAGKGEPQRRRWFRRSGG